MNEQRNLRGQRLADRHGPASHRHGRNHKARYVFDIHREYHHPNEAVTELKEFCTTMQARIKAMGKHDVLR